MLQNLLLLNRYKQSQSLMDLQPSQNTDPDTLPRIHSHKKTSQRLIVPSQTRTQDEEAVQAGSMRQRSSSSLHSNRKALQSANSSKAVRLQVTTASYHKKIEQLQRQQAILNKEIQAVNSQIFKLRLKKKGASDSLSTITSRTFSARPQETNKIDVFRRRLDKEKERTKKIMLEVEKVRREIHTTKSLNLHLAEQLQTWNQQLSAEMAQAHSLDGTLALKNEELQKKKIEVAHQKAKIIKDYDAILHKLENELNAQGGQKLKGTGFYLTDVESAQHRQRKKSHTHVQNSPKGHKAGNKLEYFRQKMEQWRVQAQTIKNKVNASTLSEAEHKLEQMHQNNYHHYQFINERHALLQELKSRNSQLTQQKLTLAHEIAQKEHFHGTQSIVVTKSKIDKSCLAQSELKAKIDKCQQIYQNTKNFVCQLIRQSGVMLAVQQCDVNIEQQITKDSLSAFLQSLLQVKHGTNNLEYNHGQ